MRRSLRTRLDWKGRAVSRWKVEFAPALHKRFRACTWQNRASVWVRHAWGHGEGHPQPRWQSTETGTILLCSIKLLIFRRSILVYIPYTYECTSIRTVRGHCQRHSEPRDKVLTVVPFYHIPLLQHASVHICSMHSVKSDSYKLNSCYHELICWRRSIHLTAGERKDHGPRSVDRSTGQPELWIRIYNQSIGN